jgi:histidyl-tRNA synthetase
VVIKRQYIINTIKKAFELYGFQPLETPAIELLEVLEGKYGEEGNKLMYKIRSNESLRDHNPKMNEALKAVGYDKWIPESSDKALRYDLTIPFARYVAMNYRELVFPFKRYQIQPVWRGDRPQRGRYREFYQCDADVAGSYSLLNEVELTSLYIEVFFRLGIDVEIKINNRKILSALAQLCGGEDKMITITIAIDKLDKIGLEKVKEELALKGLNEDQINIIQNYLLIKGNNSEKLTAIKNLTGENEIAKKGIEEIEFILSYLPSARQQLSIYFTLARGLNYYTGIIYEVQAKHVQMGSIGGGGRYDDLTGLFGVPGLPGIGISFGLDRIYDVMEESKLFPDELQTGTKILFFNLGEQESQAAFALMKQLRSNDISCELYHEQTKFDKQFKYAEKKNIPYIIIIGSKELAEATLVIKELKNGGQQTIKQEEVSQFKFHF